MYGGYDGYAAYNQAMAAYGASANQMAANAAYGAANQNAAAAAAQQAAAAQSTGLYSMFGDYSTYGYGAPAAAAMGYSAGYPYQGYGATTAVAAQAAPPGPPTMAAYRNASSVTIGPQAATAAATKALSAVQKPKPPAGTNAAGGTATGYAYESAVYSAATSYLQSKATGHTGQWLNKKTGKPFPQKTRFNGTGGANSTPAQQYYCETCKISCAGSQTYKEHIEGQKHKKKEALAKGEGKVALPRNKISFRCDVCNVTCTGQDTYNSHVKGSKHQKAVAICKKMGKDVPTTDQPTIIPPSQLGGVAKAVPPAQATQAGGKKVVGVSTISFVPSGALSTTAPSDEKKKACLEAVGSAGPAESTLDREMQALLAAEQSVKPVGEEYIEAQKDHTGKLIQFLCKLCDCKFSDPNAKDIHLKGRRHRLQYKVKVNPNLEVDVKQFSKNRVKGTPVMPRQLHHPGFAYQSQFGSYPGAFGGERRFENMNDRYIQVKHNSIYPEDGKLQVIEMLVFNIEKGLKNVSDYFAERDAVKEEPEGEKKQLNENRTLQGVMRVGILAKQLILKNDTEVEVVVLCTNYPTETLIREVAELLPGKCDEITFAGTPKAFKTEVQIKQGAILVSVEEMPIKCRVTFTSRVAREEGGTPIVRPANGLPLDRCLQALADLRRAKWFQARCPMLQSCQVTLRILRDLRQRIPSWMPLDDWTSELLVERILASSGAQLSVGDAFRRVFEAISAGILFTNGPGLSDPCEKEKVDALARLSSQQREDITSSAQHALRLIAFNQLYRILEIEKLPFFGPGPQGGPPPDRKRPASSTTPPAQPEKVVKVEPKPEVLPA